MSNVTFSWANLPLGYCWTGPQQYMNDIFEKLTGTMPGGANVVISADPPQGDSSTVWIKTQGSGNNIEGIYLFEGDWKRPHPIEASSPSRMIWTGTEADLWLYEGGDGNDPSGGVTPTTGPMWEKDTAFDFRFPIGSGTNTVAYAPDPATSIAQGGTGGEEKHVLLADEMPIHSHAIFTDEQVSNPGPPAINESVAVEADVGASSDKEYWMQKGTIDPTLGLTGEAGGDSGTDKAHSIMPPFVGVIFAKRTSRTWILG